MKAPVAAPPAGGAVGEPCSTTPAEALRGCLDAIGYAPDELVSVLVGRPGSTRGGYRLTVAKLVDLLDELDGAADLWHSPAVVGPGSGRGTAAEVVRLPALWADLDVKPGGMPSWDAAHDAVDDLAKMLGSDPVYVTMSGHGLQPVWAIDPEDSTDVGGVTAALARFGLLVRRVCHAHYGAADAVFDPVRVLRTPGTVNHKNPDAPVAVTATMVRGRPLSLAEVVDALDAYDVPGIDPADPAAVVAPAGTWGWGDRTCVYVRAMVDGWGRDTPTARHPWAVAQGVRLAAAHRLGCITAAAHRQAVDALTDRMKHLCTRRGAEREFDPREVADALAWGVLAVETKTDQECAVELGDHHRHDPPPPEDVDDAASWPALRPFDHDDTAGPFPLWALPGPVRAYVTLVAERVQVDPLLPAGMALGVVAAVAQKTARVVGPGWSEQLSLFVLLLAEVSERKSPAHAAVVGALYDVEAERDAAGAAHRNLHNEQRRILDGRLDAARKAAVNPRAKHPAPDAAAVAALVAELDAHGPELGRPRLVLDNVTVEKLKGIMALNEGRAAVVSPELSFLSILEGAYSSSAGADLAALLSAYTGGEPLVVDRVGREGERIPHPALSVVAVGQPSRLVDLHEVKGAADRGLTARFVIARARPRAGTRTYSAHAAGRPDLRATDEGHRWGALVAQLAARPASDDPPKLRPDPAGLTRFVDWANAHEAQSGPGGRWELIAGFAGKAAGLVLRVAGLLWLAEHPRAASDDPIPDRVVAAACDVVDWALLAHEDAIRGTRIPESVRRAGRLVDAAARGTLTGTRTDPRPWAPFTLRDVRRQLSGGNTHRLDADAARDLVDTLTDHGYVKPDPATRGTFLWRPELDQTGTS